MRVPIIVAGAILGCIATAFADVTAARAEITLAVGGALAVGAHTSIDGTVRAKPAALPLIDLDADLGRFALHGESVPYVRTARYGDRSSSDSRIDTAVASLRAFAPGHRTALGVGYGALFTTVDRLATPGSLVLEATGLRVEGFERFPLSPSTDLEVTLGGIPHATGTLVTDVGIPGAHSPHDRLVGTQVDATLRAVRIERGAVSFDYGIRYIAQSFAFDSSRAIVESNNVILPFAEVRLRL